MDRHLSDCRPKRLCLSAQPWRRVGWLTGRSGEREASIKPFLFAVVVGEVEGEDAFMMSGALKHFRMAQRANGVAIAGAPVLLHAGARKIVVLRLALVVLGAVDQVHDVVDLMIAKRLEQPRLGAVPQRVGEFLEQVGKSPAQALDMFEAIGAGAGTTRILNFLLAGYHVRDGERQFATCIPQVDLECQSVEMRTAVGDPLQWGV